MANLDDSLYFIYPRTYKFESLKEILQDGFIVSIDKPTLKSRGMESYTEEAIANFGVEYWCKECLKANPNANSCVVLRIPKFYLGLDQESDIDMSPIFWQMKKGSDVGITEDRFGPMHSLILGVYSPLLSGYVASTNYSPICDSSGILTDDQREVADKFVRDSFNPRSKKYYDMLEHDRMLREKYPHTSKILQSERKGLEDFYAGEGSEFTHASNVLPNNPRHRITDNELQQAIANNQKGMGR